jgi:hypothetical protein
MHYDSVGCENHLQFEYAQEALRAYDDDDDYKIVIMINDDDEDDFENDNAIDDNNLNYNEA